MPARTPTDAARAFTSQLGRALQDLPSFQHDRPGYDLAIDRIRTMIIAEGGAIRSDWNSTRLRIHGIAASATSGVAQACRNWIAQVTLKSSAAAIASVATTHAAQALS